MAETALHLATTDELVAELIGRSTFAGVVIRTAEITDKPVGGQMPVTMAGSMQITPLQTVQLISGALAAFLAQWKGGTS